MHYLNIVFNNERYETSSPELARTITESLAARVAISRRSP
jgi:hypothetical protein